MATTADLTIVDPAVAADKGSYVDWPAIIGGIVVSSAISILLLTFGSAVGLSFTNFSAREGADPFWIAIIAASWFLWVEVSSFMCGAYLTGRLRRRHFTGTPHEVDVRDGAHGILVWAGGLVVAATLAATGVGALASAVGSVAGTAVTAASNVAGGAAQGAVGALASDPNAYTIDTLFRAAPATGTADAAAAPAAAAPAATQAPAATDTTTTTTTTAPAATTTAATPAAAAPAANAAPMAMMSAEDTAASRAEAGRIFAANTVTGEFNAEDRTYLAQQVAAQTGISQADAESRVDQAIASVEKARADAAAAAETARKTAVIAAFLVAASLLVSAIGAYWAAHKGGQHRDEGTVFAEVFRRW